MKTKLNLSSVGLLIIVAFHSAAQSRQDNFDSTTTTITEIIATPLADGGCSARWQGVNVSADGGTTLSVVTPQVDLQSALGIGRCNGLATQGLGRVNKALRLDPDGGVP